MTTLVKIIAKIKIDSSNSLIEMPVLLTEHGVFEPLLEYIQSHCHDRSLPWMNRSVLACQLLLEYMQANQNLFSSPEKLFQAFVTRLSQGTIADDGSDSSGLYWLPRTAKNVNQLIAALNSLTDWLALVQKAKPLNPFIEASSHQEKLNYAAWFRRNQHNFLGHIKKNDLSSTMKQVRKITGKRDVIKVGEEAIFFPENLFKPFILDGLGGAKDSRVAIRDQLIVLLMHGTGIRESDALHLWVDDVFIDPSNCNTVIVKLYHPEFGRAPRNWVGRKKQKNRAAYLSENFQLKPRNLLSGTARVGWKTKIVDHQDNYIQLQWFPAHYGEIFSKLWNQYLYNILPINRKHPYAFISFAKNSYGNPLTLNAFNQSYKAAMARINQVVSKVEGRSPHGHRHAYGRRMSLAGIEPRYIQKAMHHASLYSQLVYTKPSIRDVSEICSQAEQRMSMNNKNVVFSNTDTDISWNDLTKSGFEDIDPNGLFTGDFPIFKRNEVENNGL